MKKTVYVPDELWERAARAAGNQMNDSQIVQAALRRYVELEGGPLPFAQQEVLFKEEGEVLDDLAMRYLSEARHEYAQAFQQGLALARRLSWRELEVLAASDWEAPVWIDRLRRSGATSPDVLREIEGTFRVEFDTPGGPTWLRGLLDALRTVYNRVLTPEAVRGKEADAHQKLS